MPDRLGIDEAGRGPVLGPLVMAGLVLPEGARSEVAALGVSDSKVFGSSLKAQARRRELATWLKSRFKHRIEVADAAEVDLWVRGAGLNALERELAGRILDALPERPAMLDGHHLFKALEGPLVKAEDKADAEHLEVAAASILAKDLRDRLLEELLTPFIETFGPIKGGGYANGATLAFVRWHLENHQDLPPFYRTSYNWKALGV